MEPRDDSAWGRLIPIKRMESGKLEEGIATVLSKDVVTIGRLPGMIANFYCKIVRLGHLTAVVLNFLQGDHEGKGE